MKKNITISVDLDLVEELQKKKVNVSSTVNDLLRKFLGPKKVKPEEEAAALKLVEIGKKWNIPFEQIQFIHSTLDKQLLNTWAQFKETFAPDFGIYTLVDMRKELAKEFKIKPPNMDANKSKKQS